MDKEFPFIYKMPKHKEFTKGEILTVFKLKSQNKTFSEIAKTLNRSKRGMYQIISRMDIFNRKPRCRRPHMTTVETDRSIRR